MQPGATIYTLPAPVSSIPTGAVGHLRATCAVGDRLLSSCLPAAKFPSGSGQYPTAVLLVVELADAANLTYVTYDGTATAASNTNGMRVPVEPAAPLRVGFKGGLNSDAGTIRVCATVGTAHLQCYFEYGVG